ncbi:DUF1963 domain-containing protein [Comamonas sp. Tr-654]|uniref:DUF1963 domain-containing protein n=1 Tax=Comamonas sp. Tr-654 TaxID=2608341 RepID=UPI00351AD7F4
MRRFVASSGRSQARHGRRLGQNGLAPHQWVTNSRALQFENGIDLPRDYLLGRPSWDSLGYDPTPEAEEHPGSSHWRSLLTLQLHEEFHWCWQDGARLMAFIEDGRLRARDFGHLQVDCG